MHLYEALLSFLVRQMAAQKQVEKMKNTRGTEE